MTKIILPTRFRGRKKSAYQQMHVFEQKLNDLEAMTKDLDGEVNQTCRCCPTCFPSRYDFCCGLTEIKPPNCMARLCLLPFWFVDKTIEKIWSSLMCAVISWVACWAIFILVAGIGFIWWWRSPNGRTPDVTSKVAYAIYDDIMYPLDSNSTIDRRIYCF